MRAAAAKGAAKVAGKGAKGAEVTAVGLAGLAIRVGNRKVKIGLSCSDPKWNPSSRFWSTDRRGVVERC